MVILVVEDEALIAMMLEGALTDAGYTVRGPASTAKRALELAELTPPDLAIVNINLRDGHGSGIALARELLARWGTPSLFVSGQAMEARANRDVAVGFVQKPYSPQTVLDSIKVVEAMAAGRKPPPPIPRELELFQKPEDMG